jgi:ANTAR domain
LDNAMSADRRIRLWGLLVARANGQAVTMANVCSVALAAAGLDAAAVTVVLPASPHEMVYATDPTAADLEELSLTLGEGPGVDALAGGPALVGDLTARDSVARWPMFAPAAVAAGISAMFALPLRVGGIRLGVIDLYRTRAGPLETGQLADALVLADTACALLLDSVPGQPSNRGGSAPEQVTGQHPEVHQATGMIIVQLGVTAAVALVRLRAYAYAHDRQLRDVARDVVARRLRFDRDQRTGGS